MQAERSTGPSTSPGWFSRRNQLWAYGGLLAASIAFDYSVYVGGLTHVYVHDVTSLLIAVLGARLALTNRALLPGGRWFVVPMALLVFVLANTILLGALHYGNVTADLRKLFWFEHGDAVRIVGELLAWVWTLGQLRPTRQETWAILDIALWGTTVAVALTVAFSIATNTPHATTTTFDVDILTGLPLAVVFVVRARSRRTDLIRLVIVGAGTSLLYSRATLVTIGFTTVAVLLATRDWRKPAIAIVSIAAGWLIVLVIPLLLYGSLLGSTTLLRFMSIGDTQLAPYTVPNRVAIWRDAVRISEISPLLGIGYHDYFLYSQVNEIKNGQTGPTDLAPTLIKSAHSDYLSWLSETGALGLAVLLGFWGSALFFALRFWLREPDDRVRHTFTLALMVSLVGIAFLGEVIIPRTPDAVPQAAIWWIVLALLFIDAGREAGHTAPSPL